MNFSNTNSNLGVQALTGESRQGSKRIEGSKPTESSDPIGADDIRPLLDAEFGNGLSKEVAPGVWLLRLELGNHLEHVNVYLLDDGDNWVLVDTGQNSDVCKSAFSILLAEEPFALKPISRVLLTHHHPDHLGLAGWFAERGAVIHATETCWNSAKAHLSSSVVPTSEQIEFQTRAGLPELEVQAYRRRVLHRFPELVVPLPETFVPIEDGGNFEIGGRHWKVHFGNGHAVDHATFWSDDGLALVGDQILLGISPNLCIQSCEMNTDPVGGLLDSCRMFATLASRDTLCLPGHNSPFVGAAKRCEQMLANQAAVLKRIQDHLTRPCTAVECIRPAYRRTVNPAERPKLVTQIVGYLNYLQNQNLARSELTGTAIIWSQK